MREFFRSKYFKWGLVVFTPLAMVALLVIFLLRLGFFVSVLGAIGHALMPFIYGAIFAYILRPIYNFFRVRFDKRLQPQESKNPVRTENLSRTFSVLITLALLLIVLVGLFLAVIPQLVSSVYDMVTKLPDYTANFEQMVKDSTFLKDQWKTVILDNWDPIVDKVNEWRDTSAIPFLQDQLAKVSEGLAGVAKTAFNLLIGLIVCIYILVSKSTYLAQSKKLLYSMFTTERANVILDGFRYVDRIFSAFVSGNVIDSAVVGLITFVCMSLFHWPYALLIACLVGVTNLIPFFGPFIGAIPSAVLIFSENPITAIYFLFFIGVLQQVDGNFLKPKIFGQAVDLPSFWTLFAILVGGSLFGLPGLLLGVPVFTIIYSFITWAVNHKLEEKDLPSDTALYYRLDEIDDQTLEFGYLPEDYRRRKQRKTSRMETILRGMKHGTKDQGEADESDAAKPAADVPEVRDTADVPEAEKAAEKPAARAPAKELLFSQDKSLNEILQEQGLDDEKIGRVEKLLEALLKELEEENDPDQ